MTTRRQISLFLASCLLLGGACAAKERDPSAEDWVKSSELAHRTADDALTRGDYEGAREALLAALERTAPQGVRADDRRVLRQDLLYRLADLELSRGRAERALSRSQEGLALGETDDVMTANLLIVRGKALEAVGRELDAADDYHRALRINEALLRRTLGEEDEPP